MRKLSELLDFLNNVMSMTDVYQPVVILHLLERGGMASKAELARVLTGYDSDVQEEYEKILMRWPKITLTKHKIVSYDQQRQEFSLNFDLKEAGLVDRIKVVCEEKIKSWITARSAKGKLPPVGASLRYRVLKAAKGKCELCGISSKISAIDIDHIVPRSHADKNGYVVKDGIAMSVDDERNLQALCFRCNRAKRDQDTTDFRVSQKKLVRDKIPEIILASGRTPVVEQINGANLSSILFDKLVEEHAELLADNNLEEIVDMIEVLLSIAKVSGYSEQETIVALHSKRQKAGSFDQGLILTEILS